MATDFKAGLDSDELDGLPSAANPLTAMGIDPDEAQANPDILARIAKGTYNPLGGPDKDDVKPPLRPATDTPSSAPSPSATSAGKTGGAGGATPSSAAPSTPEEYEKAGMQSLYENAQSATKAAGEVPTQTPQEITDLTARRAKLAAPAPRFDKTTGKELTSTQEYDPDTGQMITVNPKASKAQKVWRGVRGGLVGLGTQGFTGAVRGAFNPEEIPGGTAYNAPSKAYQQAEGRREQALSTTDTNIDNARKNWVEAVKARQAQAGEFRSNAALGKDLASAAENSTKNTINQFKADATADNYKTKADEASNKLQEQMQKDLQTAQTNEQRIQILRDNASMADQLHRSQLEFAKQKLDTTTDARTIDQWQKEQLDSVNKDYNGVLSSVWNRIRWGSKQDLIGKINIAADARRAAVGLGTGAAQPKPAPATATASTPPAKGYTRIKASDGNLHDIPSDKLAAAQQRDPKLSVVGAGK